MRILAWVILVSLVFGTALYSQTLEDAQRTARQLGFTGELKLHSTTPSGSTVYSGEGLALEYGGGVAGTRTLITTADSWLNNDATSLRSSEDAKTRALAFIVKVHEAFDLLMPTQDAAVFANTYDDGTYSGWIVDFYEMVNSHKTLPNHHLLVNSDGAVLRLMYVPLSNKVPSEAKLTCDEAKAFLLKKEGKSGAYTYHSCELTVVPDQKGGCALAWVIELDPSEEGGYQLMGAIDATTGAVLFSGSMDSSPGPPPPAPIKGATQPVGQASTPASEDTSKTPVAAYALAALAALLLIFLVVKLRKR